MDFGRDITRGNREFATNSSSPSFCNIPIAIKSLKMTSLISVRHRPGDVASLASRAIKYALPSERTAARNLRTGRQLSTLCLARRSQSQASQYSRRWRVQTGPTQCFPRVPLSAVRWNSEQSGSPTFRQWGFEDVSLHLYQPLKQA